MAFANTVLTETAKLGSGEVLRNKVYNIEGFSKFEDGLLIGRFAKYDTGSADNLDGSSIPQVAGLVVRKMGGVIDETSYKSAGTLIDSVAEIATTGFATVDVVASLTPAKYGIAYAENQTSGQYGKATTVSSGNVDSGWVFWEQVDTNLWLVAKKELVK